MANPFFVQPAQFGPGLQSLAGSVQQFGQQQQEKQRLAEAEEYKQRAKQAMAEAFQSGDPAKVRQAVIEFPEIGETAKQLFGFTNEQTEQVARETYRRALSETDPQRRAAILEGGIETVSQFGGNPRMMAADLQMLRDNPEAFERSARAGYAALASEEEYEAMFNTGGPTAPSNVREYEYYNSLSPEDQRRYLAMKRSGQTFRQGDVTMAVDPLTQTTAQPITEPGTGPATQESEQARLTRQQSEQAASKEAATQAIKTSKEAFDQIRPIKTAIANVDEAIRLIDEGANTGVIASKLPSVQEASIGLDNLQGRLGLDVIGNTTFGALSEAELRFALDTALPTNMEGPALKRWLREKQAAQKKLANYLEDAATFLGKPGNTIADFIEKQKGSDAGESQDINALIRKYAPED